MVRRAGAMAGNRVMVTGTIGDASLGVRLRNRNAANWELAPAERDHLLDRYLLPQPRCTLAEALRNHASSAMDVSDGLAGDLGKLCRTSGVTADIDVARVPLSDAAKAVLAADPGAIETVLTGGDDYEILCTVPPDKIADFHVAADALGVPLTEIGNVMVGDDPPVFRAADGRALAFKQTSYSHF